MDNRQHFEPFRGATFGFVTTLGISAFKKMKSCALLAVLPLVATTSTVANQCSVVKYMGCFTDSNNRRILSHTAAFGTTPSAFPTVVDVALCCINLL